MTDQDDKTKPKEKDQAPPPLVRPKMEQGPDGEWEIADPEGIKKILGTANEDSDEK